jgi:hypothetical protein
LPSRLVDQPLDNVDRLGKPRTAGDADRRRIGQHRADLQCYCRDAIHRARQMDVLKGLHPGRANKISAGIGGARHPQAQKVAFRIERQRGRRLMVAGLMIGEQNLAAGRDPFDWPADAPRCPQDQHMLGIDEVLGAKAAADIGRDKAHRRGRDT